MSSTALQLHCGNAIIYIRSTCRAVKLGTTTAETEIEKTLYLLLYIGTFFGSSRVLLWVQ